MITFHRVTFTYPNADRPTLVGVDLHVGEGELALVVGPTGVGKSTLLRMVNGLVPRFSGGRLEGRVEVGGRDIADHTVGEMADLVGHVAQDPSAGFVADTVEEELAFTMEQLGLDPGVMRKRVEEVLDLMGLTHLRSRRLADLSGGEAQRVAIGAVLTAHPKVMVLDEPTSALDPAAAEEVLASITRLVHDVGTTVLMAEHRLERVVQYADRVIHIDPEGRVEGGAPAEVMETSSVAPPVVRLGRLAGWSPLPLSVRDARRQAASLVSRLRPPAPRSPNVGATVLEARGLTVAYGDVAAVRGVDLRIAAGEIVALMGRNGAGKSSLLWALQGTGRRSGGRVSIGGVDPATLEAGRARRLVALVPHEPSDLLFMETVADECGRADATNGSPPGTCLARLRQLVGDIDPQTHPADLSEGQKLALVLAIQLGAGPEVLLLDEPTRGMDYAAKQRLSGLIGEIAAQGTAVMVATHDVEFAAETAHRVVVMAEGEIVADDRTATVVVSSPVFAPQVAKVLAGDWLTVGDVAAALEPA